MNLIANFYKSSKELKTISPFLFLKSKGFTVLVLVTVTAITLSDCKFKIAASMMNRSYLLALSGYF
jgi:hypothetical protein